jgi:hypothetical protein
MATTIEELLKAMFSVGSAPRLYNEDPRPAELVVERVQFAGYLPDMKDLSAGS